MYNYNSNITKAYLFNFFISLYFIGGIIVPFFTEWGRISFTQIMLLQSFYVFAMFILEAPLGAVADYCGRKVSVASGSLSFVVSVIIYSSYQNFWVFILAEFFWALGGALISGAEDALVYDSLKIMKQEKNSKSVFAKLNSFGLFAMAIAAPIGSIVASKIGLRITMLIMAIPYFAAALIAFSFKEPKVAKSKTEQSYISTFVNGAKYFIKHKPLRWMAFDCISIDTLVFFIMWLYQAFLQDMGISISYFGFVASAITAVQVVFMNATGKLERLFGSKKEYLLLSAIIAGGSFICLSLIRNTFAVIILILIIAGFGLTRNVLFQTYFNRHIKSSNRSTVLSSISMASRLLSTILYPIMGLMIKWSMAYSFAIIGFLIIICAIVSKVEEKHLIG